MASTTCCRLLCKSIDRQLISLVAEQQNEVEEFAIGLAKSAQAEKEREEAIKALELVLLDDTTLYETSCYGIAEVIINAGYRLDTKGDV